jgi:KipI family sensor histidine kinase inhibitor
MRLLPSGTGALLVELDDLHEVLGLYAALQHAMPDGVLDLVPAARTLLVVTDTGVASLSSVAHAIERLTPREDRLDSAELVEVPVVYDGVDLEDAARLIDCDTEELVRRHTAEEWTVAFCGFMPGFGYLVAEGWQVQVPRRSSPRTKVPSGSVALAGEFSGVYPRESPGGWQLIGRCSLAMFDPSRDPAALLRPGTHVRFIAEQRR